MLTMPQQPESAELTPARVLRMPTETPGDTPAETARDTTAPVEAEADVPPPLDIEERQRQRDASRDWLRNIFLIAVAIPTLLSLFYYLLLAPSQYEAKTAFTIEGSKTGTPDLLSGIGIPAMSDASNDGRVVVEYGRSEAMVAQLRAHSGFNEAYSRFTLDPFSHLSPHAAIESARRFWEGRAAITYDATGNIVTVVVKAYTPQDAQRLAQGVLDGSAAVVNSLGNDVRRSAISLAARELATKREDYDRARRLVTERRGARNVTMDAQAQQAVATAGQIDQQIAKLRADQAAAGAMYQPDSPQARALDTQLAALDDARRQAMSRAQVGPGQSVAAGDIASQTAMMDYEFAQKNYYAALQAFSSSSNHDQADRRYIVPFIPPLLPEKSDYFSRLWNVFAVALGAAMVAGTGLLAYAVVKDHME